MKIILIILSIIGLLKLVSLFILCVIEVYNKIKGTDFVELEKVSGIYKASELIIIPSIKLSLYGNSPKRFDFSILWFNLEYYSSYCLKYGEK